MKDTKSLLPNIILSVILLAGALTLFTMKVDAPAPIPTEQDQVQTSLLDEQVVYPQYLTEAAPLEWIDTDDLTVLEEKMQECEVRKQAAHQLAETARSHGCDDSSPVIELAQSEYAQADEFLKAYQEHYDELTDAAFWAEKESEYYYASKVWQYLKNEGYNDWVCAGIIGNMMTECGGQTLALQVTIDDANHYGMCQWSHRYFPQMIGASFETQLDFLCDSIEGEFDVFAYLYQRGFSYEQFCALTNERQAARAFAVVYERCASRSYTIREDNAVKAYNYFVGE